jgi:5-formyltetrahydrofolate cyclo-ligase
MTTDVIARKAALRREIRARLKLITPVKRTVASREICQRLRESQLWHSARTVLFFAPMLDEPDLWSLLEESLSGKKTVALPRHVADKQSYAAAQVCDVSSDLCAGKFGIREPTESCREIALSVADLVLVPGVAFDLHGRRLGRGRGFYDRILTDVKGIKCGVSFDEQIVGEVPVVPTDVQVNFVVTPTRWIETGN